MILKKLIGAFLFILFLTGCGTVPSANLSTSQGSPSVPVKSFSTSYTGSTVTFNLKAAVHPEVTPAKDMPKEKVVVDLPLYPKASTTTHSTSGLFDQFPASPYLKVAKGKYIVSTSEQAAVSWYKDQLTKTGYTISGSGTSGNVKTGVSSTGISFEYAKDHQLTVIMSFQSLSSQKTLMQYDVQYIATPAKNSGSVLPKNLKQVVITYKPVGYVTTHKKEVKTITDPQQLSEIRSIINGLKPDTAGVKHCAMDTGQGADLTFTTTDQQTYEVTIHPACLNVYVNQGQALVDHGLWKYVTHLFPSSK